MKLSKKLLKSFNAMADERIMAIAAEVKDKLIFTMRIKKDGKKDVKITLGDCRSHVHACIFNGLINAYTMGRKIAKTKKCKSKEMI